VATNKNQHFVPRCYLRPFSQEEEGKVIRLFNIDRLQVTDNAAVKHQCSSSYFYGNDEQLENAIQFLEQSYAATLRNIRVSSYKQLTPKDEIVLKRFWLFQYLRTEAASKRAVEMNNHLGEVAKVGPSFKLGVRDAVIMAMHTFAQEMHIIDDMRVCLVKNSSSLPFITSDDPAVITNRWFLYDRRHLGHTFGLQSAGVLLVMPVSPKLVFIAYDPDVYAISKISGIANTRKVGDVRSINQLQILNCRANVFPGPTYDSTVLYNEYQSHKGRRLPTRHVLHYSVLDKVEGQYKRYRVVDSPEEVDHQDALVHMQALFPKPDSWPMFLHWRRKGFGCTNGTGMGCIRRSQIQGIGGPSFEKMYTRH
jgi:hypothetical protein